MLIWCDKVNLDVVWTEKYKGSSEKTVRVLIYQWKYAKCFIWNFINLNPPTSLYRPLSLFLAPTLTPSHSQNTHTHTHTHRRRQKSLWALPVPSVNDILFTNMLNSVAGVMVTHTLTCCLSESYILSLYSNDLWPNEAFNVATTGEKLWTLKKDVAHLATLFCNNWNQKHLRA